MFFPLGLGPPLKIGKECCFSFGILFSCTGEQSGVEAGGGSWDFARHIWKVRKKGDGGDSHPAGCFACHSEESEAKFSPSRRQKILELWLTPVLPGQTQYSSCVLLIPSLSLLTLRLYSNRHKETFKREMDCWVSVLWARALGEYWSPGSFFLFYIALMVALRSSGLCAWRLNSASLKREIWVSVESQTYLPSCLSTTQCQFLIQDCLAWNTALGSLSRKGKSCSDATEENGVKVCNTPGQRQRSRALHTCLFPVRW